MMSIFHVWFGGSGMKLGANEYSKVAEWLLRFKG